MFKFPEFGSLFTSRSTVSQEQQQLEKLEWAISVNEIEKVREILNSNLNIDQITLSSGASPLYIAVMMQNLTVIDLLLKEKKADPNIDPSTPSMFPLRRAVAKGSYAMTSLLVLYQANYDHPSLSSLNTNENVSKTNGAFINFYQSLIDLMSGTKVKLKSAQEASSQKSWKVAQEMYQAIAQKYQKFLESYLPELKKDHQKFLRKFSSSGDCRNFAVEAFQAHIEAYRAMALECVSKGSEALKSTEQSDKVIRNRPSKILTGKENKASNGPGFFHRTNDQVTNRVQQTHTAIVKTKYS